jgi:myosin heavy subunit
MSQQAQQSQAKQSEAKQSTSSTGLKAPIAVQIDRHNKVENFIKKYNITKNTSKREINIKLAEERINSIFEQCLKKGKISMENGKYSVGDTENLSKQELLQILAEQYKEEIKEMVLNMRKNINLVLDRIEKDNEKKQNLQQINQLQKEVKSLEKTQKQLNNTLQRQKKDLLEATYKQARIESQVRGEIAQQEFQKTNAQLTGLGLMQGMDQLKQGMKGQILQSKQQQQTANIEISNLQQKSNDANIDMSKFLTQTALDEERNRIAQERLQTAKDANQIFSDQLKAAKNLNELTKKGLQQNVQLRNTMITGFNNLNSSLNNNTKLQLDAIKANTKAIESANAAQLDEQVRTTKAINDLSNKLGSDFKNLNSKIADLDNSFQKVGNKMDDLEDKLKKANQDKVRDILKELGKCPAGFDWNKIPGGWKCAGGTHFVSDSEVASKLGII